MASKRGRPREYDEETALEAAVQVFWTRGFSATSLDDLAAAMQMNRPSIYRAFGDKEAIYRRALGRFAQGMEAAFARTVLGEENLRVALTRFYREAVLTYTAGEQARGCLVMGTAVTAATCHPEIQADLLALIRGLDAQLARRFQKAVDDGQLPAAVDTRGRAAMAQALLHSLSIRARAGETPQRLRRLVESGVELLLA